MGEIAEDMIAGYLCQHCGQEIDGDEPGYPRNCTACESDNWLYEGDR